MSERLDGRLSLRNEREDDRHNHPRRRATLLPKEDDYGDQSRDATLDMAEEWATGCEPAHQAKNPNLKPKLSTA